MSNPRWTDDEMRETLDASAEKSRQITRLRAEVKRLRAALERAAHELELLYFFAISNGIAEAGCPPHVQARAAINAWPGMSIAPEDQGVYLPLPKENTNAES